MSKARIPAMLVLFATAALLEATRLSALSSLSNADSWWHLSTGLWMLQHHAIPHQAIFSQSADAPWTATSWLYNLLLALAYRVFDLRSLPLVLMVFKTKLAVVTFLLAGSLRGRFWPAVILSAIAQYV